MSRWKHYRALRREFDDAVAEILNNSQPLSPDTSSAPTGEVTGSAGDTTHSQENATNAGVPGPSSDADSTESDTSSVELSDGSRSQEGDFENSDQPIGSDRDLTGKLAKLSLKHNLTHACINDIAALLLSCGHSIPKDARTILGTQRRAPVEQGGTFIHFGLRKGIQQVIMEGLPPAEVKLQVNIDGVPLYKSSSTCLWPILCRVMAPNPQQIFIASIYCGPGKPPNVSAFVMPFLDEMQDLIESGMVIKGRHIAVKLQAVVCDAVARSYLKCIKSHSGYYGCERCTQRGVHQEGKVTFPEQDAGLHTNETFRQQLCPSHHVGQSPFLQLDIDIISLFPLDYMHLLCLCVMRRLLQIWVGGRYGRGKMSTDQQRTLSERLNAFRAHFPSIFQRKPRGIEEIERWKATEYHTFLMYTGPVALKKLLPDEVYEHFLILHAASRLLAMPSTYITQNEYAEKLLKYFVQEVTEIYGVTHLVYNVHSLTHLAADCKRHGPLDAFSAFPFESYLGRLKKMLRTTSSPLSQLSRRISELSNHTSPATSATVRHEIKLGDCYLTDQRRVVRVNELHTTQVRVSAFSHSRDFFVTPLKSSVLGIFRVSAGNGQSERTLPLSACTQDRQCVMLPYKSDYVVIPVLHHH